MGWLLLIAPTLVGRRYFDVAARDVEMAIAAFTPAKLSEVRAVATAGAPAALQQRTA